MPKAPQSQGDSTSKRSNRLPGLEWLRVGLTLAVVALHAGMSYLTLPFPGLVWSTHDNSSICADAICWTVNAVVMPGFFILGGFSAAGLLNKLGPKQMASHRVRRLGGPFLLGCVLILPLDLYVWLLGWAADGVISLRKLRSLKFEPGVDDELWGVAHLWFLQYLLLFCLIYAGWRVFRNQVSQAISKHVVSTAGVAALAAVSTLGLFADPQIVLGFHHSWHPLPAHVLYYFPMFVMGIVWSGLDEDQFRWRHVIIGLTLLAVTTPWRSAWLAGTAVDTATRAIAVAGYTYAGWFLATGLFGLAKRWQQPMPASVTYLAAASFWIYLFHHPITGLAQVAMKQMQWSPAMKFGLTFAVAVWLSLATYQVAVRNRWIGRILGEAVPQKSRATLPFVKPEAATETETETEGSRRAA